jgi:hypothetical protein
MSVGAFLQDESELLPDFLAAGDVFTDVHRFGFLGRRDGGHAAFL